MGAGLGNDTTKLLEQKIQQQDKTILELRKKLADLRLVNESLLKRERGKSVHVPVAEGQPKVFTVRGVTGPMSNKLNGKYKRDSETYDGRATYSRIAPDGKKIVLWYWTRKKFWLFSRAEHVGTE